MDTTTRTAYLSALQDGIKALQADVNALLTQKMDQDKGAAGAKEEDRREEENYGEDVGEE
jgi:hypothetical protein